MKLHEDVLEVLRRYLIQVRNECPLAEEFLSQDGALQLRTIARRRRENGLEDNNASSGSSLMGQCSGL